MAQLSLPINNDDADDDLKHHYLSPYLEHFLPSMGLDRETYAPYVIGLYVVDDNDDNNNNDNEEEETEALNEIIDLLQSSSDPPPSTKTNVNENSNDDDNEEELWNNFRIKIQSLTMDHRLIKSRKREEFLQKEKDRIEDEARTMRMQIDLANEERENNDGELPKKDDDDEGADERALRKKALIERFMYDESVEYDANGDPINELSPSSSSDAAAGGKMKVGATTAAARVAERGGAVSSKKEEQQKTKLAKKDKERKKEERRGRARRGERKS